MSSSEVIGIAGIIFLLVFLAIGVPIGVTLATVGFLGIVAVKGISPALGVLSSMPFHFTFEWVFVVVPMFLLLGHFSFSGGVGEDAYNAALKWVGRVPGCLCIATTVACTAFAFASGSSFASAATFTKISLPEMRRHNYDVGLSCGCIAASGTLAALIPPSGLMVIYTIFTDVSLGRLLIAGILPGILTASSFIAALLLMLRWKPELAPRVMSKVSLKEKLLSIRWLGPLVVIIASLLGGIYIGVFTPTEGAAIGACAAFIISLLRKGFNLKTFMEAIIGAVSTTSMIFLIIIGAMIFGRFLALSGLVSGFIEFMKSLPVHPMVILLGILFIYLILGCLMEVVSIFALTLPVFVPLLSDLGFDGIWIGILLLMVGEIGTLTPPVGEVIFVVKASAGDDVSLEQIYKGIMPFFFAYIIAVIIVICIPSIALWLPQKMG